MFVFSILIGLKILDVEQDWKRQNDILKKEFIDLFEKYPPKKTNRDSHEKIVFFIGCEDNSNIK